MAFSFSGFQAMLIQSFPEIDIKGFIDETEFNRIFQYLVEQIDIQIDVDTPTAELVSAVVSQLESIMTDSEHIDITSLLDKAANSLTLEITGAYHKLRGPIHDTVSAMTEEAIGKYEQNLIDVGAEVLLDKVVAPSVDFNILRWGKLSRSGYTEEVYSDIREFTNLGNPERTIANVVYATNRIPQMGFKDTTLNQDALDIIIDELNLSIPDRNREDIAEALPVFLKLRRYNGYCANIKSKPIEWIVDRSIFITSIANALNAMSLDLSDDTIDIIKNNIQFVNTATRVAEYKSIMTMKDLKGSLIIGDNLLNESELKRFTDAGGTNEDIAYHLRALYEDKTIPRKGISTDTVLDFRDRVNRIIGSKHDAVRSKMHIIKLKALHQALKSVFDKHLREVPEEILPSGRTALEHYRINSKHISRIINMLTKDSDNIEDSIYAFLMEVDYPDTLVNTLYKYLGKEYGKLIDANDDPDTNIVALADVYVVATLLGEYFKCRHLKK